MLYVERKDDIVSVHQSLPPARLLLLATILYGNGVELWVEIKETAWHPLVVMGRTRHPLVVMGRTWDCTAAY